MRYEIDTGEETKFINPEDVARLIFSKMKGTAFTASCVYMCVSVNIFGIYLHVQVYMCMRVEVSSGAGIRSTCKLLDVGAGN